MILLLVGGRGRRGRLVLLGLLTSSRSYHLAVFGGGLEVLIREVVLGVLMILRKSPSSGEVPSRPSQASTLAGHLLQLHHGLGDTSWTSGVVTEFFKSPYFQSIVHTANASAFLSHLLRASSIQHTDRIQGENSENSFTSLTPTFYQNFSLSLSS